MSAVTKEFIEEQNEKLATMVAQGFAATNAKIEDLNAKIQDLQETKADKADIERLEALINAGMGRRMEETDRVADRVQRLELRVGRVEASAAP